jgi:hypothetical protein
MKRPVLHHLKIASLSIGMLLMSASGILAETMNSASYTVQFGNFNVTSGEKSSASYNVTDTVGQIAPGQYDGTGYVVKAGFQYIYPFRRMSLKISKTTISLGELTYGSFNTDSHTVTVDTNGAGGYAVRTFETHPLRLQAGTTVIRDTLCDSGPCSETTAQSWTNANNHGFGFNANGNDVSADFTTTSYFRQFADISNAETMQTIMSGSGVSLNRVATITYKASPAGNQEAGNYETTVSYQLIPTY